MQIEVTGGTVDIEVTGTGRPLVLLHSLLADRQSFARIIPALARRFRIMVPDLPGFGGSSAVEGGLDGIADRVAAALRTVVGDERPILLGNGFGAFVALTLVVRHPTLVERLIVADGGAMFSEPGREAFRGMARAAAAKGLGAVTDTAMRRLFAPEFQDANPDLMAERRTAFLRTDPAVFANACQTLATLDLRSAARHLRLPVLVLVGEQDEATPPRMSCELSALVPGAQLLVLRGCAHVPQLQDPHAFLTAIDPFLL